MDVKSNTDKVCIIGAGSSGLTAAKTFSERGIPFDCLERERDIGGLWNEATNTGVAAVAPPPQPSVMPARRATPVG
jgi:cation diffusion facilitator CzcD-associated flavoprotein CzcO